jgi:orotidine-5'-phosphate decarboxylase
MLRWQVSRFIDRLLECSRRSNSLLCVGLDVDPERVPEPLRGRGDWVARFNRGIIEATSDLVCAYKPNLAFYEALGEEGMEGLRETLKAIPPGVLVIGDAKRGDVGHTARAYATALFDRLGFDAVTVSPYMGKDSVEPFLAHDDRGAFVLCKTSNPGSMDFQNLSCMAPEGRVPLYQLVAMRARLWNARGNVGLVVGATFPQELAAVRGLTPDLPLLIPGVGAQAGDLERTVLDGTDASGELAVINSSRQILYASSGADWQDASRLVAAQLRDGINGYRATKAAR